MNDGAILELSQVDVCGMRGILSSERREQAVVQRRVRERRLGLAPYILLTGFFQSAGALSLLGLSSSTF